MAEYIDIEEAEEVDLYDKDSLVLTRAGAQGPMILEYTHGLHKEPMCCLIPFMGNVIGAVVLYPSFRELMEDYPESQFYRFDSLSDVVRWL